jgi:spoIIIJ-associated protein
MRAVEIEADSVDAAIAEGLHQLGATEQDVDITVLDEGSRGVLGLGARKARVRITLSRESSAPTAVSPSAEEPSTAVSGEAMERAQNLLTDVFQHLAVPIKIEVTRAADHVTFNLVSESAGFIIGKRGQMLDALEYIVNRVATRDDAHVQHIVLDVAGYRERRRQYLEALARRLGEQVKRKRKPVQLEPMSPRDRRIVHIALQSDPALTTRSTGEGYYRRLVISPKSTGRS